MLKKLISCTLVGMMTLGSLAGCGASKEAKKEESKETKEYEYTFRDLPEPKYIEAAEGFAQGTGTMEDPYQISSKEELAFLSEAVSMDRGGMYTSAYYLLIADLALNDVSDFDSWAEQGPEYSWRPITALNLNLHFDGGGHTISGMYINTNNEGTSLTDSSYGLFATLMDGEIKNLTLDQSYLSVSGNTAYVGGIVGTELGESLIENCVSNAKIDVYDGMAGGVVASLSGGRSAADGVEYEEEDRGFYSTVKDCVFQGSINQVKEEAMTYLGGIAGESGGNLLNCHNTGSISFDGEDADSVGGIVGKASGIVSGCENAGEILCVTEKNTEASKTMVNVGGIVGHVYMSNVGSEKYMERVCKVDSCINTGSVTGAFTVGGIAGHVFNDGNDFKMEILNCVNQGNVASSTLERVGGVIGKVQNSGDSKEDNSIEIIGCRNEADLNSGEIGGIAGELFEVSGNLLIKDCENTGNLKTSEEKIYCGGIIGSWILGYMDDDTNASISILNCKNKGKVDAPTTAGGIVAAAVCEVPKKGNETSNFVIDGCVNNGEVIAHGDNGSLGGLVGLWGMESVPASILNSQNAGNLILANQVLTKAEAKDISFTLSRMVGGLVGRVGGLYLRAQDDGGSKKNINKEDAILVIDHCSSTGAFTVNNDKQYPDDKDQVRFINYFGGVIGNAAATDTFSLRVENTRYQGFERGLGSVELPDVGEK